MWEITVYEYTEYMFNNGSGVDNKVAYDFLVVWERGYQWIRLPLMLFLVWLRPSHKWNYPHDPHTQINLLKKRNRK